MESERRLNHGWLWAGFIVFMVGGAALVYAGPPYETLGFALLVLPLVAMGALALAFYLVQRKRRSP